jgi:hypothetical protein
MLGQEAEDRIEKFTGERSKFRKWVKDIDDHASAIGVGDSRKKRIAFQACIDPIRAYVRTRIETYPTESWEEFIKDMTPKYGNTLQRQIVNIDNRPHHKGETNNRVNKRDGFREEERGDYSGLNGQGRRWLGHEENRYSGKRDNFMGAQEKEERRKEEEQRRRQEEIEQERRRREQEKQRIEERRRQEEERREKDRRRREEEWRREEARRRGERKRGRKEKGRTEKKR